MISLTNNRNQIRSQPTLQASSNYSASDEKLILKNYLIFNLARQIRCHASVANQYIQVATDVGQRIIFNFLPDYL